MSRGVCERVVRMSWDDVPWPWAQGFTTVYDTGVDESVFLIEEDVPTSLEENDDPSLEGALSGPEREEWCDAAWSEYDNLMRFNVIQLVPADCVPDEEDIYDTMAVCKQKRGANNVKTKKKVRCVLCGN